MTDAGVIPFRVRVGVTGHRQLSDGGGLAEQVRAALGRIRDAAPGRTPIRLTVVSPLAEGADQLVARVALEDPEASLEAVLPAAAGEYVRRFEREESGAAFHDLAGRASSVVPLGDEPEAPEAGYARVGRRVVESSDVLLAVWDGEPARGPAGTADVVAYARERGVPVYWIDARPPFAVREEPGERVFGSAYRELDRLNAADVHPVVSDARLLQAADAAGLPREHVRTFSDWLLPYYTRADALADRLQKRYRRLSNTVFFAAAAAVAAAGAQILFTPDHPRLVAVEIGLLAVVLAALSLGRRLRVHERWIAYRVLAERLRSALFLALAGAEADLESLVEQAGLGPGGQWPRRAYDEVWRSRPRATPAESLIAPIKRFVADALIEHQLRYHEDAARRAHRRQQLLSRTSYALFAVTIVAAVFHGLDVGNGDGLSLGNVVSFLAVALPALGGALAGIEAQRQYERTYERSHAMAHRLELARDELEKAVDLDGVRAVVQETENILLDESADWLVTVRFQGIKLAV